jgi:hypothetical protein
MALSVVAGLATFTLVLVLAALYIRQRRTRARGRDSIRSFRIGGKKTPRSTSHDSEKGLVLANAGEPDTEADAGHLPPVPSMEAMDTASIATPSPVVFRTFRTASVSTTATRHQASTPSEYTDVQTLVSVRNGYGYADRMYAKAQEMQAQEQLEQLLRDHPSIRISYQSNGTEAPSVNAMRQSVGVTPEMLIERMHANRRSYIPPPMPSSPPPAPPLPDSLRAGRQSKRSSPGITGQAAKLGSIREGHSSEFQTVATKLAEDTPILAAVPASLPNTFSTPEAPSSLDQHPPTSGQHPTADPGHKSIRPQLRIDTGGPAPLLSHLEQSRKRTSGSQRKGTGRMSMRKKVLRRSVGKESR